MSLSLSYLEASGDGSIDVVERFGLWWDGEFVAGEDCEWVSGCGILREDGLRGWRTRALKWAAVCGTSVTRGSVWVVVEFARGDIVHFRHFAGSMSWSAV